MQGSGVLKCAYDDLRADRNVVLAAVSQDSSTLIYVLDERLLCDKEIILASISSTTLGKYISLKA